MESSPTTTGSLGGSIIAIASVAGIASELNVGHYAASKAAVNGLVRTLAAELAPHNIRVNSINPTNVNTPMSDNDAYNYLFSGGPLLLLMELPFIAHIIQDPLPN